MVVKVVQSNFSADHRNLSATTKKTGMNPMLWADVFNGFSSFNSILLLWHIHVIKYNEGRVEWNRNEKI